MIVCNARTLHAPLTGVQRYTSEILVRIPEIAAVSPRYYAQGPLGHLWEQALLPLLVKRRLLWSPGNTGPLAVRRQVVTVHDLSTFECPEGFSRSFRTYYNWLLPRLLPRVAAVIAVSAFTRERIIERFKLPADRVHAIPLGVDHSRFYPRSAADISALRSKMKLPERYVLFVGAFSGRKNLARLVEAWRLAQKRVSDGTALIIAGGAGMAHVFDGARLPVLPPRTLLLGRIDDNDLPILLSAASVFVFPSLYEGFGLPPLEAMACGVPCLVSNKTSLPEVVGDAALQVNPMDTEAIALGLVQLLGTPVLANQFMMRGRERARQFTWEATAAATASVLRSY